MPTSVHRIGFARWLGHAALTGLGIVLAVTPVTLWIAWTATQVVGVMLVALASAVLFARLTDLLRRDAPKQGERENDGRNLVLPDEFIEEVHRLFPLTYHHSRHETTRFRQAMKRLSRLIEESKPAAGPR